MKRSNSVGRYREEPTKVVRLPLKECRMIRAIAKHWQVDFKTAFRRLAGKNIQTAHDKIRKVAAVELGGEG